MIGKLKAYVKRMNNYNPIKLRTELDALYGLLYRLTHDVDDAIDLAAIQTQDAFAKQWKNHREGRYLLSDPWFKANVARILSEQELQITPDWFRGKTILDVGCGNGRWSYGFAELGANITATDINPIAIEETKEALASFDTRKEFHVCAVEDLSRRLPSAKYDLVFCWGVLHHCKSFTRSLNELLRYVRDDGILYLYLYGRESLSYSDDIELFKYRIKYNSLPTEKDRYEFLLSKANNDATRVHNLHDLYAPLINRRLEFNEIEQILRSKNFENITRTIDHSELFVRAIKSNFASYKDWLLPPAKAPFWFQHH